MATMLTRNTFFHTPKSLTNVPSLTLPKPSRVFFASNYSDCRNATEGPKNISANWSYTSSTTTRRDAIVVRASGVDDVKKSAQEANEKIKDAASSFIDNTADGTDKAIEQADKTDEALKGAVEKAKETAGGAWEAFKDETEKIKKTVDGKKD